MQLVIKPAAMTFAAGVVLTASISVATTQLQPATIEESNTRQSDAVSAKLGGVTVASNISVPSMQDYYWTSVWQQEEAKALAEIDRGEFLDFETVDDLLSWLDEPEA